jgi:hypothetical protein
MAEFSRNASSNPSHLHDVHFAAARANALDLSFRVYVTPGKKIKLLFSIL